LIAALGNQVQPANEGDLDRSEWMLTAQASTPDALFRGLEKKRGQSRQGTWKSCVDPEMANKATDESKANSVRNL
jgi:hypothetical protein